MPEPDTKLSNHWCFTDFEMRDWGEIFEKDDRIVYLCYQKEKCPSTGKDHFQGYLQFRKKLRNRLTAMKKIHNTAHWGACKGSDIENYKYCSKNDSAYPDTFEEFGEREERTKGGTRSDLQEVKKMIDGGASEVEIADAHFGVWCQYHRAFTRYRMLKAERRREKTEVEVYLGEPGSGKSRAAWERYPDAYDWNDNKWWDGYENQEVVIMDDFKGNITYTELLKLMDRYPKRVETKGGFATFNSKKIIITSCVEIEDWYEYDEVRRKVREVERRIDKKERFKVLSGGETPPNPPGGE